jgi:hypothetical protein
LQLLHFAFILNGTERGKNKILFIKRRVGQHGTAKANLSLTGAVPVILAQKVLYEVLHEPVLLRHAALEADHLDENLLVAPLEIAHVGEDIFVCGAKRR